MEMKLMPSSGETFVEKIVGFKGKVYFGVPQETTNNRKIWADRGHTRKKKAENLKINNATILSIMEHGSPVKNIPPRELLRPVVKKHEAKIREIFNKVYMCLLEGNEVGADKQMDILAQRMQRWTQAYFVEDNGWAPNAPSTIKAKGSDKPLIDTGSLRQSIRGIYVKK